MSAVSCNTRSGHTVALCFLGVGLLASAPRIVSEIDLYKKWTDYSSTSGVWGSTCAEAASVDPEEPEEQQSISAGGEKEDDLNTSVVGFPERRVPSSVQVAQLSDEYTASVSATSGAPVQQQDLSWNCFYAALHLTFPALYLFARERVLASDSHEDNEVLQRIYQAPPFRWAVQSMRLNQGPLRNSEQATDLIDKTITELDEKIKEFILSPQPETGVEDAIVRATVALATEFMAHYRTLVFVMTCSERFSKNRRQILLRVREFVPRAQHFFLIYFRFWNFLKVCRRPHWPSIARFETFLTSSAGLTTSLENLITIAHSISVSCAAGMSSKLGHAYYAAVQRIASGVPILKALGPLFRPPGEESQSGGVTQPVGQTAQPVLTQQAPSQSSVEATVTVRKKHEQSSAGSHETPVPEDRLPNISYYIGVVVGHMQAMQQLDSMCNGMMSREMGDEAIVAAASFLGLSPGHASSVVPGDVHRKGDELLAELVSQASLREAGGSSPSESSHTASPSDSTGTGTASSVPDSSTFSPASGEAASPRGITRTRSPCTACLALRARSGGTRTERDPAHSERGEPMGAESRGSTPAAPTTDSAPATGAADTTATAPSRGSRSHRQSRKKGKRK